MKKTASKTISCRAETAGFRRLICSLIRPGFSGVIALTLLAGASGVQAQTHFLPNASFETPPTPFAGPEMGGWQKAAMPFWFPYGEAQWDQTVGQFLNTTNGAANHIVNMDGRQAAFLFAVPDVAIFQDANTFSGTNTPRHDFIAQYEAGKAYTLTVGVLGNGGGMSNGVTLELSLYYRDLNGNIVTVGATTITNSAELFPTNTAFTDFQVRVPKVQPGDAWAGKRIGIRLASTVDFALQGGYWDVDNVRLTESVLPNASFEEPATPFAGPEIGGWQKSPMPFWFPYGEAQWDQVTGQFLNTTNGAANHIDNLEGKQAAFVFAVPDAYLFQDYNSLSGTNPVPSHNFNAKFEPGKAYALTVGVLGNGGGMSNGVTFELSLYYRDASSNMVTVAATTITNSAELFPNNTHLTDFQVLVPTVRTGQAWAGRNIGIKLASTTDFLLQGGYWDIDNVRLTERVVPNASFEEPPTPFAGPEIGGWQKSPMPFWFPYGEAQWDQLTGQFLNTTNGAANHITNLEGRQAAFLFAAPNVALFQDYTTLEGTNTVPTQDMTARFEVGRVYNLTVGVLGGGGGMTNGATLEISFYYRDAASNQMTVAATTITNSAELFPINTAFTDFQVVTPAVRAGDAWAGKHLGVKIASTVDFSLQGGYWDIDNVRVQSVRNPFLKDFAAGSGQFKFALDSAPGRFEILTAADVASSLAGWTSLGTVTNLTGTLLFTDPNGTQNQRFYQARPVP